MVFPAIEARGFPGNREEANRAGTTPKIRRGTYDTSTGGRGGPEAKVVSILAEESRVRALKIAAAVITGLALYAMIGQRPLALALFGKATGGDQPCPWSVLLKYPWAVEK